MAQHNVTKLDTGDAFPQLTMNLAGGGSVSFPADQWSIVMFCRGKW